MPNTEVLEQVRALACSWIGLGGRQHRLAFLHLFSKGNYLLGQLSEEFSPQVNQSGLPSPSTPHHSTHTQGVVHAVQASCSVCYTWTTEL